MGTKSGKRAEEDEKMGVIEVKREMKVEGEVEAVAGKEIVECTVSVMRYGQCNSRRIC